MRTFQEILEKGRKHFEERVFQTRLTKGFRCTLIPGSIVMLVCLFSFRWDLFLLGFLTPMILLSLLLKRQESLSPVTAARYLDQDFHLRDILTTAQEFHVREGTSPVLRNLLADADQSSGSVNLPGKDSLAQLERFLLLLLFILLVLLNFYHFFSRPAESPDIRDIQTQIENLPPDSDLKKDLQSHLNQIKSASDQNEKNSEIEKMCEAISKSQGRGNLEKPGNSLQKSDISSKTGEAMSSGDLSKASQEAGKMASDLGKGISPSQKESLGKAVKAAKEGLDKDSPKNLKDTLEKMEKNIDKPGELQKAAQDLSKQLENLARQKETEKIINQKLESLKKSMEKGDTKKDPGQNPKDPPGKKLDKKDGKDGKSSSGEDGREMGKKERGDGGNRSDSSPNENGKKKDKGGSGKNDRKASASTGGEKKTGKNEKNSNGKGGKDAGGELDDDPQKLLKNGKSKGIHSGNRIMDNQSPEVNATMAQMLPDYEKAAVLSEKEKIRLKIHQEAVAKSREIDEFSRHHRIPDTFRNFLKDFYSVSPQKTSITK